jgi:hypothetical protein
MQTNFVQEVVWKDKNAELCGARLTPGRFLDIEFMPELPRPERRARRPATWAWAFF